MSVVIDDLHFAYETDPVLNGIATTARPGRIVALIGPNASGKSTLLRCIIGQLTPARGSVLLDGRATHRTPPHRLARRMAYVTQRSTVAASFTVRQVVEIGRFALPNRPDRVDDAIERLDLAEVADRPYPALSVGQQQRVMLARAVAQLGHDGVLVLDEPTSAMDLAHVRMTASLLRELASNGATIIWAVHDVSLAARVASDAWLLADGRLVDDGSICDVMNAEQLSRVFAVGFEWMNRPDGSAVLIADA